MEASEYVRTVRALGPKQVLEKNKLRTLVTFTLDISVEVSHRRQRTLLRFRLTPHLNRPFRVNPVDTPVKEYETVDVTSVNALPPIGGGDNSGTKGSFR